MPDIEPESAEATIDKMVAEANFDKFFDANPATFTDDEFRSFITYQREERARIALKKERKKEEDDE